ncbi:MAG: hypothetical protein AAF968_16865, partial [Pseudomonadota bacterium]
AKEASMTEDVDHTRDVDQTIGSDGADQAAHPSPRTLEVDVERYQHLLDDPALTDAQKQEIIEALWSIIISFVDLGFGVHPAQQACGQLGENQPARPAAMHNQVYCEHRLNDQFEEVAGGSEPAAARE